MLTRRHFLNTTLGAGLLQAAPGAQPAAAQQERRRVVVDSQVHMWRANSPERPWAAGRKPQLPEPMTIERLLPMMDEAGVDRVVVVPPSLEGDRIDYGQEAALRHPGRFATMGRIALNDPSTTHRLPGWRDQPALLGIRINVTAEQTAWLTNGTADWFWPAAEKAGIPVMFLTANETALFGPIAERHPRLTLIIDHMGISSEGARHKAVAETMAESAALAKYPNVSVKLSAAPLFSAEPYPFRDMTPHLHRLFDAFGPMRCHWGTDLTNSFAKGTYRQRVTHFTEELKFLSEDDKDWIMGRAILARLRWA
jgi:predicted TIM-barrel fold metal-dependent hydrolase